ncbi:hypothetical protein EMPG_09870 [Blastomyces silverae]|uniref:Uncharacterized protein n=1 Tax=Blastomyces silverae TaxID=2060906 RepID=A0A0H1BN61_9EURO|nr:hypothetical protein EMPG_09870 [Blastomyces silverae]
MTRMKTTTTTMTCPLIPIIPPNRALKPQRYPMPTGKLHPPLPNRAICHNSPVRRGKLSRPSRRASGI